MNVNLGCGSIFVNQCEWVNLDVSPVSSAVRRANLLGRLPVESGSAHLVYVSHFLEHVPRPQVERVLRECRRVLEPGGVLRLVLPDLEEMTGSYLALRAEGFHEQANYLVLEMIDQCVRREPGGELGKLYSELREVSEPGSELVKFIRDRTGEDLTKLVAPSGIHGGAQQGSPWWTRVALGHRRRLSRLWVRLCLAMLPAAFREQNVSMAAVGERHHWLWDFYQLNTVLTATGFVDVQRRDASSSAVQGFPFYPLDLDEAGRPRMGAESMYVEARRPGGQ